MKSLHTRLDYRREQVLKVTELRGRFFAMDMFGVKDYHAFCNWLEEVTGDANFGLHPVISPNSGQTLGDQLVEAFLRKVADLEAQLGERDKRIEFLEWQLSHSGEKEDQQALAILEACQT